jgi:hypothetical protein
MKGTQSTAQPGGSNTISFLVLNIRKSAKATTPTVSLVSKTAGNGTMKRSSREQNEGANNYLTLYIYSHSLLADSMRMDHPLYKHYEYMDGNGQLASKDTIVEQADFIVRFQTEAPATHIVVSETLKNTKPATLGTIKL